MQAFFRPFSVSCEDEFAIKPQNQAVVVGGSVIFKCKSKPASKDLTWYEELPEKDKTKTLITHGTSISQVEHGGFSLNYTDGNFDLHIDNVKSNAHGTYICELKSNKKAARAELVVLSKYIFQSLIS